MDPRLRSTAGTAGLAAVLAVVGYTAYLLAIGYRPPAPSDPGGGTFVLLVGRAVGQHGLYVYVPVLAGLGAGAVVAARAGTPASVLGLAVALAAYPWVRPFGPRPAAGGPTLSFAGDLLVVAASFAVVAGAEYAIRNRDRLRGSLSPRAVRLAVFGGVAHFVAVLLVRNVLAGASWGRPNVFTVALYAWLFVGLFVLAGIPTLLAVEFRLLGGATVVAATFAWASYETLTELPRLGISPGPMSTYGLGWFVVLVVALAVAGAERAARERLQSVPPPSTGSGR